jgi:hypothetical protein
VEVKPAFNFASHKFAVIDKHYMAGWRTLFCFSGCNI